MKRIQKRHLLVPVLLSWLLFVSDLTVAQSFQKAGHLNIAFEIRATDGDGLDWFLQHGPEPRDLALSEEAGSIADRVLEAAVAVFASYPGTSIKSFCAELTRELKQRQTEVVLNCSVFNKSPEPGRAGERGEQTVEVYFKPPVAGLAVASAPGAPPQVRVFLSTDDRDSAAACRDAPVRSTTMAELVEDPADEAAARGDVSLHVCTEDAKQQSVLFQAGTGVVRLLDRGEYLVPGGTPPDSRHLDALTRELREHFPDAAVVVGENPEDGPTVWDVVVYELTVLQGIEVLISTPADELKADGSVPQRAKRRDEKLQSRLSQVLDRAASRRAKPVPAPGTVLDRVAIERALRTVRGHRKVVSAAAKVEDGVLTITAERRSRGEG